MFSVLTGCTQGEFCNLELFSKRYGKLTGTEVNIEDFIGTEYENKKVYMLEAERTNNSKTLIKLFTDSDGRICECRVIISKTDENKSPLLLTYDEKENFIEISRLVVCSVVNIEQEKVNEMLLKIITFNENTKSSAYEKTAQDENQRYVFLSNELVSELVIYNKWLCKAEETQKPESKAAFDGTTNIRTDTVAHK